MRDHRSYDPTWPLLCVLVLLFVVVATAPRAWQEMDRQAGVGLDAAQEAGGGERVMARDGGGRPPRAPFPGPFWSPADGLGEFSLRQPTAPSPPGPFQVAPVAPRYGILPPGGPLPVAPAEVGGAEFPPVVLAPAEGAEAESDAALPAREEKGPAGEGHQPEDAAERWMPKSLLAQLERLGAETDEPEIQTWAKRVSIAVRDLIAALPSSSDVARGALGQVIWLGRQGDRLSDRIEEPEEAVRLRRALHAAGRRVDIWRRVMAAGGLTSTAGQLAEPRPERLRACLAAVEQITRGSDARRSWRSYLGLDQLRQIVRAPERFDPAWRRAFCRAVVDRLTRVPMTAAQRRLATSEPMLALRQQLRCWAAEPVDLGRLLERIERFEATRLPSDARLVAEDWQRLAISPVAGHRDLARRIEMNYGNANLRVAIRESLLNRLVPERDTEFAWVRDSILGTPVRGRSWNRSDVAIRLIPDADHLRFGLEVQGRVSALTAATSGPATFYNDSQSRYQAQKALTLSVDGVATGPTRVAVANHTRLRRLETDFDIVPVLNFVVRGVALSQMEERRPAARQEVQQKVAARVRRRIDEEVAERVAQLNDQYRAHVLDPLAALALRPTMVEARTTEERLTMRLRLATLQQLGGCTPRPRAPGGSVASFQVHESAVNNVVEQLGLNGQSLTLAELRRHAAAALNLPHLAGEPAEHDDLKITFAAEDALAVRFQDGQIAITLSIQSLRKPPRSWSHFQVRAFYRPEARGRAAVLVRDGVVHLIGGNLRARSQIPLRGIFSKVFHRDRTWPLTPEPMTDDPRLAGLEIAQLVVAEGWIGVAWAPAPEPLPVAAKRSDRNRD